MPEQQPSSEQNGNRRLNVFSPLGLFGSDNQAHGSNAELQELMYGTWKRTVDWQDRLHQKAAHKALNIPEENMINAPHVTNVNGLGFWGVAALLGMILLFFTLVLAAMGYLVYTTQQQTQAGSEHVTTVKETRTEDVNFRVWDAVAGEWIEIPNVKHIPDELKKPTE